MNRLYSTLLALALVLAVSGCAEHPASVSSQVQLPTVNQSQMASMGYVATPSGWFHRSCVVEIPDGAYVDASGLVTRRDKTTFLIPTRCAYPSYPNLPRLGGPNAQFTPTSYGWIEDAQITQSLPSWYSAISAYWRVPPAPAGQYTDNQLYYTFPGLQANSETAIIQSVLQYGRNSWFGGNYWTLASWSVSGGVGHWSSWAVVQPGDLIFGWVRSSNCDGTSCDWAITSFDITRVWATTYTARLTKYYNFATGGALETYGLTSCDQYPGTGVVFGPVAVLDASGRPLSPTWTDTIRAQQPPLCSFNVTSTSTTVTLSYNGPPPPPPPPSLDVSITGPSRVNPNVYCYYSATVSGGVQPYSYAWMQGSTVIGTDEWVDAYTGNSNFLLSVTATDAGGAWGSAQRSVTVTPSAPTCPMRPSP